MGVLAGEELELPKTMVKEVIRARRNQIYLVRARANGKMLYVCSSCGELAVEGDQHRCFNLPWGEVREKKGVPQRDTLQIKTAGKSGLKIQKRGMVDWKSVQDNFNQLKAQFTVQQAKDPRNVPTALAEPDSPLTIMTREAAGAASPRYNPSPTDESEREVQVVMVEDEERSFEERVTRVVEDVLDRSLEKYFRNGRQN